MHHSDFDTFDWRLKLANCAAVMGATFAMSIMLLSADRPAAKSPPAISAATVETGRR